MGFLNELKKLAKPYDDEEDFDDFQPKMMTDELPLPPRTTAQSRSSYGEFDEQRNNTKVRTHHTTVQLKVALFNPDKFEAAAEIADNLRDRHTVVLNLEQTNKDIARRLVDFLSGVVYAQEGKIKKVAVNTYLLTPYNVEMLGDLIDELENSGLYY